MNCTKKYILLSADIASVTHHIRGAKGVRDQSNHNGTENDRNSLIVRGSGLCGTVLYALEKDRHYFGVNRSDIKRLFYQKLSENTVSAPACSDRLLRLQQSVSSSLLKVRINESYCATHGNYYNVDWA